MRIFVWRVATDGGYARAMPTDEQPRSVFVRVLGGLWRAITVALHALAGSSGDASAALDDPRTDVRVRRQRDVPH